MRGILLALSAISLTLAGCDANDEAAKVAKAPAGPRLTVGQSETTDWQDVSAEVTTVDQAQVFARIPGILVSLSVKAGDTVRRGQVIGRVVDNQSGYQAQALAAQSAQAQADLARVRFLYQNGVYAKARLEQAETAASAARAQHAAMAAVAGQGAVVAPANGRVLKADIPAGAPVAPGMPIAVITAGDTIVRLEMPETLAARVHAGSRVTASGNPGVGTVIKLYPSVTAGQVVADVAMPGIDNQLIGRRVAARVETGKRKAMLVPAGFVTNRFGIDYVMLVAKDGSAAQVPVQTAASAEPGKVEILSGVASGDVLAGVTGQ